MVVTLPLPGYYIIDTTGLSSSTGGLVSALRSVGSGEIVGLPNGSVRHVYNDGTNVRFVNLQDVGTYIDYATSTVPTWIGVCSKPPFLNCDGSTFSAITYPALAAILGGTTLPDLRGASRATLNQGTGRITTAGSGINGDVIFSSGGSQTQTLTTAQIPSITSTNSGITLQNASPSIFVSNSATFVGGNVSIQGNGGGSNSSITSQQVFTNVTVLSQGISTSNNTGGAAHPIMQPTTISGITLIRAA